MWENLEAVHWVQVFSTTGWMYNSIAVMHYITFFWCIGSIAVVDLRVLGVAAQRKSVTELSSQLFPWAWVAFALAVISGFMMFAVDAGDWAPDPVFHVKLTFMILALIFGVIVQLGIPKWALAAQMPTVAKIIAFVGIALWILTIISGSEIPGMEGLG